MKNFYELICTISSYTNLIQIFLEEVMKE